MISTNDMRPGMTLDLDGELWSILEYQHHKPGKGHAMVRTKVKSLRSGVVVDRTFRADEKVEIAPPGGGEMRSLKGGGGGVVSRNNETYEKTRGRGGGAAGAGGFLRGA